MGFVIVTSFFPGKRGGEEFRCWLRRKVGVTERFRMVLGGEEKVSGGCDGCYAGMEVCIYVDKVQVKPNFRYIFKREGQ